MHYFGGTFGGFHMIGWIAGIVLLVWLISRRFNEQTPPVNRKQAMDILKKRFVRGEITREEFEEARKIIDSHIHS